MLGEFAVGKTSLVRRFVYNKFEADYLATIGVHVSRKEVVVAPDKPTVNLVLWDLAGGETFSHMEASYYRGGAGALVVADVTRPDTLTALHNYAMSFLQINPQARLVLLFNKIDLAPSLAEIEAQARQAAARWQAPYFLTSALSGEGVESAFQALAAALVQ